MAYKMRAAPILLILVGGLDAAQLHNDAGLTLQRVKNKVVASTAFRKRIDAALPVFCKDSKKVGACHSFVQDAVFCLDLARHAMKFRNLPGAEGEMRRCQHIDKNLPNLSLLASIISEPGAYKKQEAFLQQMS